MPRPLDPLDSLAGRAHALAPRFECTWSEGGLNAAWIHLTGELDVDTTPQLEQTLSDPDSQAGLMVVGVNLATVLLVAGPRMLALYFQGAGLQGK